MIVIISIFLGGGCSSCVSSAVVSGVLDRGHDWKTPIGRFIFSEPLLVGGAIDLRVLALDMLGHCTSRRGQAKRSPSFVITRTVHGEDQSI